MKKQNNKNTNKINNLEITIGKIMRIGVCFAVFFMLLGIILLIIDPKDNLITNEDVNIVFIIEGLKTMNPYSFMLIGILLLILTPILRVITTIVLFIKKKDIMYVFITIIVLIILIISFIIGNH